MLYNTYANYVYVLYAYSVIYDNIGLEITGVFGC